MNPVSITLSWPGFLLSGRVTADPYENVAKVIRTNSGMDIGLLDPGFCNAKLVNSYRSIEGLQEDNIIYSQNHHAEVTASTPLASAPSFLFRKGGAFFG